MRHVVDTATAERDQNEHRRPRKAPSFATSSTAAATAPTKALVLHRLLLRARLALGALSNAAKQLFFELASQLIARQLFSAHRR